MNGLQLYKIDSIVNESYNAVLIDRVGFIPPYEYIIPKMELLTVKRFRADQYEKVETFTPDEHILAIFTDTLMIKSVLYESYLKGCYIHNNIISTQRYGSIGFNRNRNKHQHFPYSYTEIILEVVYFKSQLVKHLWANFVRVSVEMSTFYNRGMYGLLLGILDMIAAGILKESFLENYIWEEELEEYVPPFKQLFSHD